MTKLTVGNIVGMLKENVIDVLKDHRLIVSCTAAGMGSFVAPPQGWQYNECEDAIEMFNHQGEHIGFLPRETLHNARIYGHTIEIEHPQLKTCKYTILSVEQLNQIENAEHNLLRRNPSRQHKPLPRQTHELCDNSAEDCTG